MYNRSISISIVVLLRAKRPSDIHLLCFKVYFYYVAFIFIHDYISSGSQNSRIVESALLKYKNNNNYARIYKIFVRVEQMKNKNESVKTFYKLNN